MAYRPPHQPGQVSGYGNMVPPAQMYMAGNYIANGNQQPRPGNAQFMQPRSFVGVAPQRYAMMQPGMGPGGYTPQMYPGQVPPQGVMGMTQSPMGYPQQAQQMMGQQQQFPGQQIPQQQGTNPVLEQQKRMAEAQQKRMAEAQQKMTEKQKKERYLEDQRRKLRQFSKGGTAALGTTKLDFDNLLGSSGKEMGKVGGTSRPMMQQQQQPKAAPVSQPQPTEDDSFGDFLQGPTTATKGQTNVAPSGSSGQQEDDFGDFLQGPTASAAVSAPVTNVAKPTSAQAGADDFGDFRQGHQGAEVKGKQVEAVKGNAAVKEDEKVSEQKVPEAKPAAPTIESMMMAAADFSRTAKKEKPVKRTLLDNAPQSKTKQQQAFEASQKAQAWAGAQNFSNMFSQGPFPVSAGGGGDDTGRKRGGKMEGRNLPAWCLNEGSLPLLYHQVLEACVRDGAIQTERVYPILIMSGLDKAVLGHIWNMANRTTPGRLTKHELYFALGMIALAQNGQPLNTEVTTGLKEAPIPNLTQPQGQATLQTSTGSPQQAMSAGLGGDEFAAFQAAPKTNESSLTVTQAISTPLSSTSVAPSQSLPMSAARASLLLPTSSNPSSAIPPTSSFSTSSSSASSAIPTLSLSEAPTGGGLPTTVTLSSSGVTMKLGDMGNLEDVGYDARYPKEEENCYIFAGSPPESGSSGRSSPLVWDPNCIYDKLTIRSKDDSESTSSLSDRTPIDEEDEDEEQFADFKSAPADSGADSDFSGFQMAGEKDEGMEGSSQTFVFEKVKLKALAKKSRNPPSIPPPQRAMKGAGSSSVDDLNMFTSSGSRQGQAKLGKFASFDSGMMTSSPSQSGKRQPSLATTNTADEFDFKQSSNQDSAFFQFQDSPKKSVSVTDFTAFQSAKTAASTSATTSQPNFADFSQFKHSASESDLMGMTPNQDDKYAALRTLTLESSTSQPEFGIGLAATPEELDEDDFEDFQQADPIGATSVQGGDGFDSLKQAPPGASMFGMETSSLGDSFAEFQQADAVQSAGNDLFGSFSSEPQKSTPGTDLFAKPAAPTSFGNTAMKPVSILGPSLLPNNQQPSSSWLDNVPLDREPPPDDDFGDFQTPTEPMKSTPDSLSIGKSDDSGSLNDFKKASASDLYGMEFDAFGSTNDDAPHSPTLNLDDQPTPDEAPKPVDPAMLFSSQSSGKLPKVNNIASLDLKTFDLDLNLGNGNKPADEGKERADSFGDFSSAPVMSPMDSNNSFMEQNKNTDVTMNSPSGALVVSSAPLVPQGTALISDRYSQVSGEIQDDNRHAQEWKRCLESCYAAIKKANNVFNGISSSMVCNEVIRSTEGSDYLTAVIEIYRVACRIITSMKAMGAETIDLQSLEKDIDLVWNNLSAFLAASPLQPDDGSFVFKTAVLRPEPGNKVRACGVCLLNVDSRSKAFDHSKDNHKLSYGGRQYHATCANLWVNMVDSILPALPLNSLL